jgi:crotonobetainyl-CoA:carnitine CoA-transferase CaiB-like acyl-CoA transferase
MYAHFNVGTPGQFNMPEQATNETPSAKPFVGLVVVELGHSVAAPFAGQILGELGARVIKVEKPDGDDARKWGPPFVDGASSIFQALNRNKESVVCDLRSSQDRAGLKQFIAENADVVLQNLRPGQVDKLELDAESLTSLNPRLIYCNMGSFGCVGPLASKPGYDPLMQAFGGIMSTTGHPGSASVRVGPSIIDMGTGMWAVIGILSALHERERTERGRIVDVSLFETATCWVSLLASQYLASGEVPTKQGSGASSIVPYKAYITQDGGEIVVAAGSDGLFRRLVNELERPEWALDPRYINNPSRVANQDALYRMLDEIFITGTVEYWTARMDAAGIPCSPVQNIAQMVDHPQTAALNLLQSIPGTEMKHFGLPLSFDRQRPRPVGPPPALGEHTELLFKKMERTET